MMSSCLLPLLLITLLFSNHFTKQYDLVIENGTRFFSLLQILCQQFQGCVADWILHALGWCFGYGGGPESKLGPPLLCV